MDAESREAAFAALRERGIKAIKVVAADGSKANGEIRGVRKRVVAVVVLLTALVAIVGTVMVGRDLRARRSGRDPTGQPLNTAPRHQIYGDPVIIERFERGDFGNVLTNRADQMLAWFAQPGRLMCPRGVDPRRMAADFAEAFDKTGQTGFVMVTVSADDSREVRELKQIVNGMREELAAYLANGNGTPRSYWRRLLERTQQEMQIFERTRRELENEKSENVWDEKNSALRRLGLRTLTKEMSGDEAEG